MKEPAFLDKPGTGKRILKGFFVFLGMLLAVDFFIPKHAELPWEEAPAFYAAYGFVACVSLIFIAKLLRSLVKRDEDYYHK